MKTLLTTLILLFSIAVTAQKVDVYDMDGKLLTPTPIEKESVPEVLKNVPDGMYQFKQVSDPVLVEGKYLFPVCWYRKTDNNFLLSA